MKSEIEFNFTNDTVHNLIEVQWLLLIGFPTYSIFLNNFIRYNKIVGLMSVSKKFLI